MKLISENLHIISAKTKEAILARDEKAITALITKQAAANPDWIDLNIGPAKKNYEGVLLWLYELASKITDIPLSFDTTNSIEIENVLSKIKNTDKHIINSASADAQRLENMTELASKYNTYLVALTLNNEIGIPKFSDKRLELAFEIMEVCTAKDISNEKIIFDPLILPICVDQSQANEAMMTIRMLKESFDPPTMTTIGLSNISNGVPSNLRPLINQVFFTLAAGCGLDSAIVDSFDDELLRINKLLESGKAEKSYDKLLLSLYELMQNFGELEDVEFDKNSKEETNIYKTAQILLNKKVYSNSYLDV